MSADREVNTIVRVVAGRRTSTSRPERVLDAVLGRLDTTPQRGRWWLAWRRNFVSNNLKAVLVGAAVGLCRSRPGPVCQSAGWCWLATDRQSTSAAPASASSYFSDVIEAALQDALRRPDLSIGAVNMSFGGPGYPFGTPTRSDQLAARGMLCVVSAGNEGTRTSNGRSIRRHWPR